MLIGILALQGNFAAHAKIIEKLGGQVKFIKEAEQLANVDGLILPGGESTTLTKLLNASPDLKQSIKEFAQSGRPILGTCAGLIMMSKGLSQEDPLVEPLCLIDVLVERNAYGPQVHSSFLDVHLISNADQKLPKMCFIRAPKIIKINLGVEVLAECNENGLLRPCAVRQENCVALSFHPELSEVEYFHELAFFNKRE